MYGNLVFVIVYIEFVIIDNLVITALICMLSARAVGYRVRKIRVWSASVGSTIVAIILPLIDMPLAVHILVRVVLAVIIIGIMTIPKGLRLAVKFGTLFLGVTFLFGGALTAIGYLVTGDIYLALTSPFVDIPLGIIIGVAVILYWICRKVFLSVKRSKIVDGFAIDAHISILGKTYKVRGLIDSGNGLYDDKTGLPIIILGLKSVLKTLDSATLIKVLSGEGDGICRGARYIEIKTVTGKDKILIVPCQKFVLYPSKRVNTMYERVYEVMVGLKAGALNSGYDALLHPCML